MLFDILVDFDASIPPLGLYACEDLPRENSKTSWSRRQVPEWRRGVRPLYFHQEWNRGLKPHLEQKGCSIYQYPVGEGEVLLDVPDAGRTWLKLIRISKIKVRKFGSHYRLDRLENYQERWDSLDFASALSRLWKPSFLAEKEIKMGVVLFIGFDKAQDPFGRELVVLKQSSPWENHGVVHENRVLTDLYERGFLTRLSAWARLT